MSTPQYDEYDRYGLEGPDYDNIPTWLAIAVTLIFIGIVAACNC